MFRTEIKDLVSHMCCFPDSFSQVSSPPPPAEEPRMVLVGRGEMIPGDPESKGIHAHLPDRNYSIHSHFSHFRKDLKWLTDATTVPPEEQAKGNNSGNTRGGQLTLLSRESLEIPASPAIPPILLWASGSPGRKGKCCIWTVEGPRVRHWHWRTRPPAMPLFPGLTLWRITEVAFEWTLPFLAEVCSVRGSQSSIFQSYCIMPSFWISSFSQTHFPILLGDT